MIHITPEQKEDYWEVEALYDLCFAPGREALSSYRLRDGVPFLADLSLVMRDELGVLGAAIRYWPVLVGDTPVVLLGPVAVHPTRQGEGLGGLLISESTSRAAKLGWKHVLLVGDYSYYSRFGFERMPNVQFPPPTNQSRVLGHSLIDTDFPTGQVGKVK